MKFTRITLKTFRILSWVLVLIYSLGHFGLREHILPLSPALKETFFQTSNFILVMGFLFGGLYAVFARENKLTQLNNFFSFIGAVLTLGCAMVIQTNAYNPSDSAIAVVISFAMLMFLVRILNMFKPFARNAVISINTRPYIGSVFTLVVIFGIWIVVHTIVSLLAPAATLLFDSTAFPVFMLWWALTMYLVDRFVL